MARLDKLRQLAAQQPHDPFVHYGIGLECVTQERWAEAVAAFEQVLTLDPNYHAAHMQKAAAELKLGQRDTARQTLEEGIAIALRTGDKHAAAEMRKTLETIG